MIATAKLLKDNPEVNALVDRHQAFQVNLLAEKFVRQQSEAENETRFRATLSCGTNGRHINIMPCFFGLSPSPSTELELKNGNQYRMYQASNVRSAGRESSDGLEFDLAKKFELKAQNASKQLLLTLRIVDIQSGQAVFEKSVSQYGVIAISNE